MADPWEEPITDPWERPSQPAGDTFADRFSGERPLPPSFLDRIARGFSDDDPQKVVDQAKREGLSTPLFPETIGRLARGTYESVVGAVTAPQKAMQGKLDTDSPEAVEQAVNIALTAGMRFSRTIGGVPIMTTVESSGRQIIGTLPRDADFTNGAAVLNSAQAEPNLRKLWDERGIHPAEAVNDAQSDAFLRDELTKPTVSPGYEHLEPTKTAPAAGSPMPEGTPRTALARTGDPLVDRILDHPTTQRVIDNAVVDDTHTIPNSWGGSVPFEDPTLFLHKDFPRSLTVDGVTFDPADPAAVHENVEAFAINALTRVGWSPAKALKVGFQFGEKAEDAFYQAHGMDPKHVEDALAPYVNQIAAEGAGDGDIPSNLYRDTYPDSDPRKASPGPIDKPTADEVREARAIIKQFLDDEDERAGVDAGAAKTPDDVLKAMPTWGDEPPPRPGEVVRNGRTAMDGLYSFARNVALATNPMAMGTKPAMVIAKDAMNAVRRIDYEHLRWNQEATRRFTAEQLYRMYNALDEESVLRQEGLTNENMGLATLTRDERNFVEYSMDASRASWMHNIEVGNVEGEGLPAYAPRIMLNMAAAVDQAGPRALNELGRNVFTRTAQMMRRGNLLAEETEAAAKESVRAAMEKRGATPDEIEAALEKVTLARDIRTLGWATARMEKAAVWAQMVKSFEEYGKNIGQPMVVYGDRPSPQWFTIAGNPAFKKWKVLGSDADGNPIGTTVDGWLHPDLKGPAKSILEESSWGSKLDQQGLNLYGAAMTLKGKAMTAIMNNPVMHNLVVYSKVLDAVGLKEWGGVHLYFRGNQLKVAYPQRVGELIDAGLNPLGPRGFIQDITAAIGEPGIGEAPGHSWTAKIARAIPDFFDPAKPGQTVGGAGDKVAAAIDKMGDIYHNTLLWDRVSDLHFGLADFMSDRLVGEGHDRVVADRIAAQFSNLVVGSIPKEAMSAGARQTMNMLFFSRSFTAGNWGMVKQALVGLPRPIAAQIERDLLQIHGFPDSEIQSGAAEAASPEVAAEIEDAMRSAKSSARWKAGTSIAMSFGLMYIGQALLQHAFNVLRFDHTVNDETQEYVRRFQDWWKDLQESDDPGVLLGVLNHLSPTYDNEPGKNNRIKVGYASDGTAIYMRPFFGKIGEELLGITDPMDAFRAKLNPLEVRAPLEVLINDQGFGRIVRDPNAKGLLGYVMNFWRGLHHIIEGALPEQQLQGAHDLIMGEGDPTVNKLRAFGPFGAFTASQGRPGGAEKGEMGAVRGALQSRFDLAWPDLRRQINRGDEEGAKQWMRQNGVPEKGNWPSINLAIRAAKNPSFVSPAATRNFMRTATPAEIERFLRAQNEDMQERARQAQ